jgi:hypothetical protein
METSNQKTSAAGRLYERRRLRARSGPTLSISEIDRANAEGALARINSGEWSDQEMIDAIKRAE